MIRHVLSELHKFRTGQSGEPVPNVKMDSPSQTYPSDVTQTVAAKLLEHPEPRSHFVQLYGTDDRLLTRNVGRYLWEGLQHGDGLLVVATAERSKALACQIQSLGSDPEPALREGRLVFVDAHERLASFMVQGQPDWARFESTLGPVMTQIRERAGQHEVRAYGEMVGVLWKAGRYSAAIRVEKFWNTLLKSNLFKLFCAYPIDVFSNEFQISALDAVLCAHTHLLPSGTNGDLETALNYAINEVLGPGADVFSKATLPPAWARMPRAEARILWLRNNLPYQADDILARARQYYVASRYTANCGARANGCDSL